MRLGNANCTNNAIRCFCFSRNGLDLGGADHERTHQVRAIAASFVQRLSDNVLPKLLPKPGREAQVRAVEVPDRAAGVLRRHLVIV